MPARTYIAANFQLVLDGVNTGFLKSVEGGSASAAVVAEPVGPSYFSKKHLGPVGYDPFVVRFGLAMGQDVFDWINSSWTGQYRRKNGAVIAADHNLVVISQREFFDAFITEVSFPKMDGASKDAAYLTLKFAPERIGTGTSSGKNPPLAKGAQKLWLSSNFRVEIEGLDCGMVRAVDSFTVRQSVATDDIGDARKSLREPTKLEFPNLVITLAESSAKTWFDWFDDFVIKGNNDESNEKNGSITLLSPNLADELLRIDLFNLGIFKIGPDKAEANSDRISMVTAHLYCERMELHAGASPKPVALRTDRQGSKARSRSRGRV